MTIRNSYPLFSLSVIVLLCLFVLSSQTLKAQCGSGESQVTVSITTDNYPQETTWELKNWVSGMVYASGGPYTATNNNYTANACVPDDATVGFTL